MTIESVGSIFSIRGSRFDVKRIVLDGGSAIIHLLGTPAAARHALVTFDKYRLKDGKVVEPWDVGRAVPKTTSAHPMF